ncbi:hypothetical protein AKO1_004808 [Acrasis kona]|uniref:Uncharacterized protein n=1 Tax=Acrasis kona TaxID=1008807 RepID=A0AAW2Z3A3_9EUKA
MFNAVSREYSESTNKIELKDILSRKVEELRDEERGYIENIEVQNHARLKLQRELDKIDKSIENLNNKVN